MIITKCLTIAFQDTAIAACCSINYVKSFSILGSAFPKAQ